MLGISKGKLKRPALVMLYGVDGCGKSTFGSEAPNPIFLGPEDGTANLDVARFDNVKTFADVKKNILRLTTEEHDFKTLVIDSIDWIEPLVWKEVCSLDSKKPISIDDAFGGWGKGYTKANELWKEIMNDLTILRETKKMNIIAIAHSHVKAFNDPSQPLPYDRYMLKLNEKAAALWREFVDCVLFCNFEVSVVKESRGDKKGKAYGEGNRVMYSERRPSFDAKNRYGLPFELPLGWKYFEAAMNSGNPDSLEQVKKDLNDLLSDEKLKDKVESMNKAISDAGDDVGRLIKIRNYARVLAGDE